MRLRSAGGKGGSERPAPGACRGALLCTQGLSRLGETVVHRVTGRTRQWDRAGSGWGRGSVVETRPNRGQEWAVLTGRGRVLQIQDCKGIPEKSQLRSIHCVCVCVHVCKREWGRREGERSYCCWVRQASIPLCRQDRGDEGEGVFDPSPPDWTPPPLLRSSLLEI